MQPKKLWWFLAMALFLVVLGSSPLPCQAQPVHFKELMALLEIDPPKGWEVGEKPKGTTVKSPVQMSEAEVRFKSGEEKYLEVKIVDGLGALTPFVALTQSLEMESSEEYLKSIKIQDLPAVEKYQFKDKEGEITLPVANRFLVTITGHGIGDTKVLHEVAGKLDLKKLASLAK